MEPTTAPARETRNSSFLIDVDLWERFEPVAAAHNRSRGAQIREFIQRAVEAHEQESAA